MKRRKPLARKARLKPGKPLGPGGGLKRTATGNPRRAHKPTQSPGRHQGLAPVNTARQRARRARDFGAWRDTVVRMPCWWCGMAPPHGCAPAHAKTRATGHDRRALLPMCPSLPGRVGCHPLYDEYKLPPERQLAHRYQGHGAALRAALDLYYRYHPDEEAEQCLACGAALDGPGASCEDCGEASHLY